MIYFNTIMCNHSSLPCLLHFALANMCTTHHEQLSATRTYKQLRNAWNTRSVFSAFVIMDAPDSECVFRFCETCTVRPPNHHLHHVHHRTCRTPQSLGNLPTPPSRTGEVRSALRREGEMESHRPARRHARRAGVRRTLQSRPEMNE